MRRSFDLESQLLKQRKLHTVAWIFILFYISFLVVNPVVGFGEVEEQGKLEITCKPGKPKADKLFIQFNEAPADMSDAKLACKPLYQSPFSGEFMVKLSAAE
ncbi:MSP domain-containing protein [Aphelenchoides besseyi]|nr:MSP domain-containing protein [Aphelenchoides besseyi]KAI6195197.1 MSP domain-containing protein [Aphelenchoides besseyi]